MSGLLIQKYCTTCNEERHIHAATGYAVDGKHYVIGHNCNRCGEDLCKEDKKILKKANADGKNIDIVLH